MSALITVSGVRGFIDQHGVAHLNLEDAAKGLGFTQTAGSGNVVVRWERVNKYLNDFGFIPTSGDGGKTIPENIFYRLAMKAKNEIGEKFQAKVADEILPEIRKHGGYLTPNKLEEALLNPDMLIQLATTLKDERAKREQLQMQVENNKPLVAFAEICMQSDDSIKVRELAHSLSSHGIKIGQNKLYDKLREWKLISKVGTEPTQRAIEQGLFEIVTGVKQKPSGEPFTWRTPYVTVKGQVYVVDRLKKDQAV